MASPNHQFSLNTEVQTSLGFECVREHALGNVPGIVCIVLGLHFSLLYNISWTVRKGSGLWRLNSDLKCDHLASLLQRFNAL